jgi:NAD(P)-dependent dehydrogenase (short-subunit alcohol dehydrogenase family)
MERIFATGISYSEDAMTQFGWSSTTDEVLEGQNVAGRRALVTGVSAGLGVETARALLAHGAEVIGAARNLDKARMATKDLNGLFGDRFRLVELDLASLASVRACADGLVREGRALDLVIANAGIMATPFARTVDGFESQLVVNHLGHFVLVNRLAHLVPDGGRVISLSSVAHQFSDIDLDDMNFERTTYDPVTAYGASKTAIILAAVEFDRRHRARGVRAAAVHPGGILTELARYMTPDLIGRMIGMMTADSGTAPEEVQFKTVPQGAATTVWAAVTAPADAVGGHYCEDCGVASVAAQGGTGVRPYAVDPERARQLWAKSEAMAGENFG